MMRIDTIEKMIKKSNIMNNRIVTFTIIVVLILVVLLIVVKAKNKPIPPTPPNPPGPTPPGPPPTPATNFTVQYTANVPSYGNTTIKGTANLTGGNQALLITLSGTTNSGNAVFPTGIYQGLDFTQVFAFTATPVMTGQNYTIGQIWSATDSTYPLTPTLVQALQNGQLNVGTCTTQYCNLNSNNGDLEPVITPTVPTLLDSSNKKPYHPKFVECKRINLYEDNFIFE